MSALLLNFLFGIIPTLCLAWSVAADQRKGEGERVVESEADRRQQRRIFTLVYGLWSLTLAMWNWMRSEPLAWSVLWLVVGVTALLVLFVKRPAKNGERQSGS